MAFIFVKYPGFVIFAFVLSQTTVDAAPEACVHELYAYSGVIESLNFPQPYPSGRNCTWIISTIPSYRVQLNFEVFHLEPHASCDFDFVSIYDGARDNDTLLGKFCGDDIPHTIFSSKNMLRIIFVSDARIQGVGFNVSFTSALCGENFKQNDGRFQTPLIPDGYPGQKECIWTINVSDDKQATLIFTSLQIQNGSDCQTEYIEVSTQLERGKNVLLARICQGNYEQKSFKLQSPTSELVVRYVFRGFSQGLKFSARFISESCGGLYKQDEGVILSPNYPSQYPNNNFCNWTIVGEENDHIWISFDFFEVWQSPLCTSDYVQILDGVNKSSPLLLRPSCGHTIPPNVSSSSNKIQLTFKTDSTLSARGFFAKFKKGVDECVLNKSCEHNCYNTFGGPQCYCPDEFYLTSKNTCMKNSCIRRGLLLRAVNQKQWIRSHSGIHGSPYSANTYCNWTISAINKNKKIALIFEEFALETCSNCRCDSLKVYDNDRRTHSVFCGTKLPEPVILGPVASVIFQTDGTSQFAGFKLSYQQI